MKYEIWGGIMPAVTVTLEKGESIYTQSGGMSWMSEGIEMKTNARGGFAKSNVDYGKIWGSKIYSRFCNAYRIYV